MPFNIMTDDSTTLALEAHLSRFFTGHAITDVPLTSDKLQAILPHFRVFSIAPGPKIRLWCFVSAGAAAIPDRSNQRMEFVLFAPTAHARHAELLTLLTYYHTLPDGRLALGDTIPIGEPWLEGSMCTHLLLSPLYALPRTFAGYQAGSAHIHLVWALPITQTERDFKAQYGREALEQRFEAAGMPYGQPHRRSVIEPV